MCAYYFQSTRAPVMYPRSGGFIKVESHLRCPYGSKCYRKRWWVQPWDQGTEIHTNKDNKPATHWHILLGAEWHLFGAK